MMQRTLSIPRADTFRNPLNRLALPMRPVPHWLLIG
uniref:Uncharacterized protein n=1 Tax=Utricularia reniformis TaxID=192314 RepID=A0A1Y0B3J2_9LAMI|nr:hypothetical protein AEK19_MT1810 [Utricularia reniformis]ART31981.1 hypothetical protein AEK19_MT1810 [Utricularia reniformis]